MLLPDGLKALSFDKLTSICLCTLLVRYFSDRNIQKCFSQHCPIEDKSSPSCPQHSLGLSFVSGREICGHQKAQPLLVHISMGIVEQYILHFSIFPYCLLFICVSAAVNPVPSEQVCSRDSACSSLWALSWLLGWSRTGQSALAQLPDTAAGSSLDAPLPLCPCISSLPPATLLPQLQMNVCVQLKEKHLSQLHKNKLCQPAAGLVKKFC